MEPVLDKFLRYVSLDTASDPNSDTQPSTQKQLALSMQLVKELHEMGVANARLDEHGYVMASLSSNIDRKVPAVGFIAHVDTSPDAPGANVRPQIIEDWDGKAILLNKEKKLFLDPSEFPEMLQYKGQNLITTDGTTLLGADDKAGVAAIMYAVEYIMHHPEFLHGDIKIGFTPDEEIGRGVDKFDVKAFGADYAYTLDGSQIGELEFENFNAAMAKIHIQGRNIHPGYAKNKMLNAILIGMELNALLPVFERPEYTQDYEGFFHLTNFTGTVEEASVQYIIRDHDMATFEQRKALITKCVQFINDKYGANLLTFELKDQYYNMRKEVEPHYHVIEKAIKAMEMASIAPIVKPIRGGTDGARLSFMGRPCPNIFAGGHNFHGKMEYLPMESMERAAEVILNLVKLYSLE
jgi:tripeptide aminopeptidase